LALLREPHSLLIEVQHRVERQIASFKLLDGLLQRRECGLERLRLRAHRWPLFH
jgi:hypothetical protein